MPNSSARAAARLVLIICCLTMPVGALWAQNENETVGFQSNHVFESGHFGEDIDVLNGGLHLTIPIGPKYEVNDRLGYQLILSYNSKVWDYSDFKTSDPIESDTPSVQQYNEGPSGIGFTLNFGRLIQDVHSRVCSGGVDCWMTTWKWVTPDGNQHDVWFKEGLTSNDQPSPSDPNQGYPLFTTDLSYVKVNIPGVGCLASSEDPACFTINAPDGLTYTLGKHIAYPETDSNNYNKYRQDNQSFGGWYVTRIEDRSIPPVNGVYPMSVTIQYDDSKGLRSAFQKIPEKISKTSLCITTQYQIGFVKDNSGICGAI